MGLPYLHSIKLMVPFSHGWDGPVGIKHDLILEVMCLTITPVMVILILAKALSRPGGICSSTM